MKRIGLFIAVLALFLFAQVAQADWAPTKRLTWNLGDSLFPSIGVDSSGNLHLFWSDDTPGNNEIYYKKSTDGGVTWTASRRLTWTSGDSQYSDVASDTSGNLHVVWQDSTTGNCDIYYLKSHDEGSTWTTSANLTSTSLYSWNPDIAVDSYGSIHLVWTEGNGEIYYKKSTDEGATWTASRRLTWTSGFSGWPRIVNEYSGNLHMVWEDYTPSNYDLYYKKSTDSGVTWTSGRGLTWTKEDSYVPAIVVGLSGSIHVVWAEGYGEIYYRKSVDSGASWTARKRLTWTLGSSWVPDIAADLSGNLHLVWSDMLPYDIYYKKSTDGGATWAASQRIGWTPGSSAFSSIVVDLSDNLHVVWHDDTPGNYEIYYKKYVKE